ncbi:MAG: hypothetical protein K2G62_05760 [Oscillospiraceae bacterium]|nr:hypothetical protein [Oscillospiraceae bacterium]
MKIKCLSVKNGSFKVKESDYKLTQEFLVLHIGKEYTAISLKDISEALSKKEKSLSEADKL